MKVTWNIDYGYKGKPGPCTIEVPDDELEECRNEGEKQMLIEQYVDESFKENVGWKITKETT